MTTKEDTLFFKDKQSKLLNINSSLGYDSQQYSNLNLNQVHKNCSDFSFVQPKSKSNNDKQFAVFSIKDSTVTHNNERGKGNAEFLNKSSIFSNDKVKKHWMKDSSTAKTAKSSSNTSTLSLHITAYENSVEVNGDDSIDGIKSKQMEKEKSKQVQKWKNAKQILTSSTSAIQAAYEFPRQQHDQITDPEVAQFKASQRLLDPSQPTASNNGGSGNANLIQQQQSPLADDSAGNSTVMQQQQHQHPPLRFGPQYQQRQYVIKQLLPPRQQFPPLRYGPEYQQRPQIRYRIQQRQQLPPSRFGPQYQQRPQIQYAIPQRQRFPPPRQQFPPLRYGPEYQQQPEIHCPLFPPFKRHRDEENPVKYLYTIFFLQDYEDGNFDVTFLVDGKELYAHRIFLAEASDVFKELFNKNRPTRDDPVHRPIQIDGYTYDEFREFLSYIYCFGDYGQHDSKNDELLAIVIELADKFQCFGVQDEAVLDLIGCSIFSSGGEELSDEDIEDIFEKLEFAYKYALKRFKTDTVQECLEENLSTLIGYNGFINLDKSAVKAFLHFVNHDIQNEELCEAVCKWGEHQAMVTVEMPKEEKNSLILHQIQDFLPFFNLQLLIDFFVKKKSLISTDDANKMRTIKVSINCNDEKNISGTFVDAFGIYEHIDLYKSQPLFGSLDNGARRFWQKNFKNISSQSNTVEITTNVNWYLLFDPDGVLYLKHRTLVKTKDYIIAEMKAENESGADGEFLIGKRCNVYATVSRQD